MTEQTQTPSVYTGPLRAAIFDWAGTTLDFGSRAPVQAVSKLFADRQVPVTQAQARGPMGMAKRDHLAAVFAMPEVAERWQQEHGNPPGKADLDRMYADFMPTQRECLAEHSELIPGCLKAIADCRSRGMKIGSSTGYTRELMDVLVPSARKQGFEADVVLCAGDVSAGRPAPYMCWEIARRLAVYPAAAIVKVDDTVVGVEAGRNAGMWAIGVVLSGNEVGLSQPELAKLSPEERQERCELASAKLRRAGAHELVDTIADIPAAVERINLRLSRGDRP